MYKSKKNNIGKNISKFISGFMIVFFIFISISFAGEISLTPLNILNKWVNSAKKSIELNRAEGKAVVKDLYSNSLKQVELTKINPMLESVKNVTASLNNNYLCNIKDNDTINILYKSNIDFKKQLKNISSNFQTPQKADMVESCGKLMTCVLTGQLNKILDSLSYCKMIVNDAYVNEYKNISNLTTLSDGNKGSDAFRNKTLSDSSYDILNDVYILAKIFFDNPEEPTEVLFYDMPNIGPASSQFDSYSLLIMDRFSPYYQEEENAGGDNGGNGGGDGGAGDEGGNSGGNLGEPEGGLQIEGELDDEIIEFSQTTTYDVEGKEGYEFLGDNCIDGFQIEGYDGYSYTETITGSISGSSAGVTMTPTEYLKSIIEQINNLMCEYDENCNPNFGTSGDDQGGGSSPSSGDTSEFDEQTQSCFASCNDIPCNAKSCDRLACYVKCLCLNYESPFFDPLENPGLGPIFKLKFCIQPVQDHTVVTSQKVTTLESVVNAINIVIQNLRNSGDLMLNKKTKEYLDAGFQKNDFSKQISFSIDGFQKVPESKGSEKQEKENQINLNTSLMENILGFEKEETANGKGRNKYIIKGGTIENGIKTKELLDAGSQSSTQTTVQSSTGEKNDTDIIGSLKDAHLRNMGGEVSDFLRSNLEFWQSFSDSMKSIKKVSESLANKK